MSGIVIIASDTVHRRYILNRLLDRDFPIIGCVFEKEQIEPPFPTGPAFEEKEKTFMEKAFFQDVREDLDRLPHWYFPTVNHPSALEYISRLAPDFAVVSGAGILREEALSLFPGGLLNLHLGIAEEYRGLDTNLWAIYHRDWENIGVTLHQVEPELDTGRIVEQTSLPLKAGMKCHELRYHETCLAVEMLIRGLEKKQSGKLETRSQKKRGRYYSFMPRDLRLFVERRFNRYCELLYDR